MKQLVTLILFSVILYSCKKEIFVKKEGSYPQTVRISLKDSLNNGDFMINGENSRSVYILYILMALPFGALHSLLAIAGIITLVISYHGFLNKRSIMKVLNLVGFMLLFAALYYFFWADKHHFNYGTFQETVPLLTLIITALIAACFLVGTFLKPTTKFLIV